MENENYDNKHSDVSKKWENIGDRLFSSQKPETEITQPQNSLNQELEILKQEISALKSENFNIKTISALEKSGCIKPELVINAVPKDCENLQDWIDSFKTENEILFRQPPKNHGGNFKPSHCSNLSPSELMNNYIRGL